MGLEDKYDSFYVRKLEKEQSFTPFLGSVENLSEIESYSINCIVSADAIEHIRDVYKTTNEMYRVLKPDGCLIFNTPNIASIKERLLLFIERVPSTSESNEGLGGDILFDGGHLHYFTFRPLKLMLEKSGRKIEQSIGYGRFSRIHNWYAPLLSYGAQVLATKPIM